MIKHDQDSPASRQASNSAPLRHWKVFGRACLEIFSRRPSRVRVETLLDKLLEATGAERAFFIQGERKNGGARSPMVRASLSTRRDERKTPSRTLLSRALCGGRFLISWDAVNDPRLGGEASVRSLGLRFVVSTPVPVPTPRAAALVLDSRFHPPLPGSDLRELLEAFAGLAALLVVGAHPESPRSPEPVVRGTPSPAPELIGRSPSFLGLLARVRRVARWPLPVLITGETGSGKEGISRTLHLESPRREGPFVAVNCAAFPESLLESELFGAVRGAYTGLERDRPGLFLLAHGGTLLLDEVGDTSPAMQAKLLRVLQESRIRPVGGELETPVDVRVLAATHRDLRQRISRGEFRADLYYRLAMVELRVPALRERAEDLPLLADHLLAKLARETECEDLRLSPQTLERLHGHHWPGNIRELEAALAGAILVSGGGVLQPHHLPLPPKAARQGSAPGTNLEAKMVEEALEKSGWILTRAAACIGWSRQKLSRRMAALGIPRPVRRPRDSS